jgi:hypothetical protein
MLVCGVDLKASEARLAIVQTNYEGFAHIPCETKKLTLNDDRDTAALKGLLCAIQSFARQNGVERFIIKARNKSGPMASGAVSFKIETLFQLSDCSVEFVTAKALSLFAKGNMGGVPATVLEYQKDAFRSAALYLSRVGGD